MPRPTLRSCFIAVAVAIVGLHLAAVTLAALPPNRYSDAARGQTEYLNPYFTQNWRLFAPSPIAEDRSLRFQGAYLDADGRPARTPWVDWTSVELDLVRHRVVGGRAGYVTNKLVPSLRSRTSAMATGQQLVVTGAPQADPPSWEALTRALRSAGTPAASLRGFLRYERSATQLGTDVLQSRFPQLDLTAVRYSVRRQGVVPYAARGGSQAERDAARPVSTDDVGGWRRPTLGSSAERAAVRDFDRRHR
ncbi:DUF5819 family protein [Aeromicrobium wangtongii]|uniref:DUF5819 family protein n=1 Tax=Aeromicrobium wangtongii TaxID=2969247 RepID=UPI00201744DA|nr:DUF5819 family protein [Aeromicrobium wangtongii]MCL3818210.1 DUF5819 family protein [Aeromicrobium wangtongii]